MEPTSLQGHLLIASPHLPDDNFFRSVVLMVQHDEQGALGLVLNRPGPLTVRAVWKKIGQGDCQCDAPVYLGGPVNGPLMLVHAEPEFAEAEIIPGLYFASQKESLTGVITRSQKPYRLFSGYSGWGEGQLESEMEAGAWLVRTASLEYTFDIGDEELWRRVNADVGRAFLTDTLGISGLPEDPTSN